MKKYTTLAFILIFSMILLSGCLKFKKEPDDLEIIKDRGYIIVGVKTDSPPFGYYKNQKLTGIDIEIANHIAQSIFNEDSPSRVEFVPVTPQNRIAKLNSKEVDILVATLSINDKRKLVLDFSVPYFVANQKIMVKKDSNISGLNYFNKNGKLVVVLGTTGEKISRVIAPNANIIGVKSYLEAMDLLKKSKADAILGDDCILAGVKNDNYKIINRAYSREFYGVGIRKTENSKELLNHVNAVITTLLDEKKIDYLNKPSLIK